MAERTAWRICSSCGWWSRVRQEARQERQEARAAGPRRPGRARLHRRRPEPAVAGRHHRAPDRRGQALPLRDQGRLLQPDRRLLDRLTDEVPARRRGAGQRRRPPPADGADVAGCVLHTDRGSQFRSRKFVHALNRHDMVGSMGRVGAAGDNAAMESFFSLLQKNVLDRRAWATREELRIAIVTWIETDLPPPPPAGRSRPIDPRRIRVDHDHTRHPGGLTEPVTRSCSRPLRHARTAGCS